MNAVEDGTEAEVVAGMASQEYRWHGWREGGLVAFWHSAEGRRPGSRQVTSRRMTPPSHEAEHCRRKERVAVGTAVNTSAP